MDNYNGQTPMGENQTPQQPIEQMQYQQMQYQQPAEQMQYQQMQYQQPMQQMQYQQPMQGQYQQPVYQNGYYAQPNNVKPKSGKLKWLFIIGIPAVLGIIAAAVIVIICLLLPSYNVDDYETVYDACYDVFDMKLKKREDISHLRDRGIVDYAEGEKWGSKCEMGVAWYEFASEELAEEYYEEYVEDLKWDIHDGDDYSWETSDKLTKGFVDSDGVIVIREDEFVVLVKLEGIKSYVEMSGDEFIDALD